MLRLPLSHVQRCSISYKPNFNHSCIIQQVDWSEIALQHNELLKKVNFWVFSVGTKLVPCILLTFLSKALISALYEAEKRKKRLKNTCYSLAVTQTSSGQPLTASNGANNSSPSAQTVRPTSSPATLCPPATIATSSKNSTSSISVVVPVNQGHGHSQSSGQGDRTTRMLLAVLLVFLVTEFPTGLLVLLSGFFGESFFRNVYSPLGDLLDLLALINSAINFILYCSMSKQFRNTFSKLFFKTN